MIQKLSTNLFSSFSCILYSNNFEWFSSIIYRSIFVFRILENLFNIWSPSSVKWWSEMRIEANSKSLIVWINSMCMYDYDKFSRVNHDVSSTWRKSNNTFSQHAIGNAARVRETSWRQSWCQFCFNTASMTLSLNIEISKKPNNRANLWFWILWAFPICYKRVLEFIENISNSVRFTIIDSARMSYDIDIFDFLETLKISQSETTKMTFHQLISSLLYDLIITKSASFTRHSSELRSAFSFHQCSSRIMTSWSSSDGIWNFSSLQLLCLPQFSVCWFWFVSFTRFSESERINILMTNYFQSSNVHRRLRPLHQLPFHRSPSQINHRHSSIRWRIYFAT